MKEKRDAQKFYFSFRPIIWSIVIFFLTLSFVIYYNSFILRFGTISELFENIILRNQFYHILVVFLLFLTGGIVISIISRRRYYTEKIKAEQDNLLKFLLESVKGRIFICNILYDSNNVPNDIIIQNLSEQLSNNNSKDDYTSIKKLSSFLNPETLQVYLNKLMELENLSIPLVFEYFSVSQDKYFQVSALSVSNGRFTAMVTDFTEIRKLNNELHNKNHLLETLVNELPYEFWVRDENDRLIILSDCCKKTWGNLGEKTPEESGISSDTLNKWKKNNLRALSGELIQEEIEYLINGEKRYYYNILNAFKKDGKIVGTVGTNIDITDRKLIEEKLRKSEEKYRYIFENASEGIFRTRHDGRIIDANPAFAEILGYDNIDEILNDKSLTVDKFYVEPKRRNEFIELIGKKSNVKGFEYQVFKKDGSIIWLYETSQIVPNESDDNVCYDGFVVDITEMKKVQKANEELIDYLKTANETLEVKAFQISRLNDELKEINNKKDKLFSIIAHDLKGPIGGFMNLTDMLFSENEDISIQEYQDITEVLNFSARNVYALLENLLDWSRSQTGIMPFKPEMVNLAVIVQNKFDLLKVSANKKKIELIKDFQVNLEVFADSNMLKTIIGNLISNAIKFSNESGKVVVSASENGKFAKISVSDTGVGIDKDIIPMLFKIDRKVSTLGTNKEKGTGLGLILCREFVEKHNGLISVESVNGEGSTFSFTLPYSDS